MANCQKCNQALEEGAVYCSECGAKQDPPEPKMSGKAIILIIVFLILFFPLGILIGIFEYLDLSKRRKEWRNQRLIDAIESKS